jgi:spore coat polysaccharide biosynthesis protein SpsF
VLVKLAMDTHIVVIIQARMGASRLPGKMMLPLHGSPIVEWVYKRTRKAQSINDVVFAIPETKENDSLSAFLGKIGASVFRGSEEDVVGRFYFAAKKMNATHVVRVCADNPFVSGTEIDQLVQFYFKSNCDYAYNHIPKGNSYPDGIGAEIVSFQALQNIYENAKFPAHRDHIFNFIWDSPEKFKIRTFNPKDSRLAYPNLKLDVDNQQDYEKLCRMDVGVEMEAHEIVAAANALE